MFMLVGSAFVPIHNASSASGPTETLILNTSGGVVSVSAQQYLINQSGAFFSATLPAYSITSGTLDYSLNATVVGETVTGLASFDLNGSLSGGGSITISSGSVNLFSMIAAVCLPNYDTPSAAGNCQANDTSAVPAFFVGLATMQVNSTAGNETLANIPMLFESAYLNPFGAPIVISSADSTIIIVAPYIRATVNWTGAIETGTISGTFGSISVSGKFNQNASEVEDLITGAANDTGSMTFSDVVDSHGNSIPVLLASGTYSGNSSIPLAGSYDCSAELGFPSGSGLCTQTGFQSTGSFSLHTKSYDVIGNYSSSWGVPAFGFSGTSSAKVSAADPPANPASFVEGHVTWYTNQYQSSQYIFPASISINGIRYSSVFYESIQPQYELIPGMPYAGYYSGTFGAISGCENGVNITITTTINGITESSSAICPSPGNAATINFVFGTPTT